MKNLIAATELFLVFFAGRANAQDGLAYHHSSTALLAYATFGLYYDSSSGSYESYLDLPSAVIGHVSYASVRTQYAVGTDVNDHNETGTSSDVFYPSSYTSTHVQ